MQVYKKTFSITASGTDNLDTIDFSQSRQLRMEVDLPDPAGLVGDTLNIYLQSRGQSGVWEDRIAVAQFLGNGGAQYYSYTIQSDVPLGATEEAGAIPGPSPASAHLTADSVRNGYFPTLYLGGVVNTIPPGPNNQPETAWRIQYVEAGTATWAPTVRIDVAEYDPGY